MNVREVDDAGNLWFLSASDSHQNQELAEARPCGLFFQASPHSDFLVLSGPRDGHARPIEDRRTVGTDPEDVVHRR